MKKRELQLSDITFTIEATNEQESPFNHFLNECMTNEEIKELYDEAINSNVWKWCSIEVKGTYKGLEASTYLGCCSYESEEHFLNIEGDGYLPQLKDEVLVDLRTQVKAILEDFDN